jgi:hypothetical protein
MMDEVRISTGRKTLFTAGLACEVFSLAAAVFSWVDPFPLLAMPGGGWRLDPREDWVLAAGLLTALVSTALAFFGKGAPRIVTALLGPLLFLFNYVAWLGNHR